MTMAITECKSDYGTHPDATDESKFVEVLTAKISGEVVGYLFGGNLPGPNALVAGDAALMEGLFDRMNQLPTLPWMWGKLFLVTLDGIECSDMDDVTHCLSGVMFDELVMLPHAEGIPTQQQAVERAYWATLRICRELGMIEGRGVQS